MTLLPAKLLLSLSLSAILVPTIAQVTFDKGYIIDNGDKKVECLIQNKDRLMNPRTFQYKLSENEGLQQVSAQDVKEVNIYNYARFVSATVEIDTSGSAINRSSSRKPEWKKETIFLKVLVDGKATLYRYESFDLMRFFFKTEANPSIRQLVYKEYLITDFSFDENATFRQQLLLEVNCRNMNKTHFEQIKYRLEELKKHFIKYNTCMGGSEVVKTETSSASSLKRNVINFSIAPGLNFSSLTLNNPAHPYNRALGSDLYFRLGVQIEYIFPFNRNKWSVFIEPTYQTYKKSSSYNYNIDYKVTASANYSSIEFPAGLHYNFFLKGGSKIFLNAFFVSSLMLQFSNSALVYSATSRNAVGQGYTTTSEAPVHFTPGVTMGGGIGYSRNAFSVEARYYGPTELLTSYYVVGANYKHSALIFAYRFMSIKKKIDLNNLVQNKLA